MNSIMIMMMILMIIKLMYFLMNNFKKKKNLFNNIECGFNNLNNKKFNMSMNFLYIMIIFILFDIELMLILPLILNKKMFIKNKNLINMMLLFMILSTILEIKNKKINWLI